MKAIKIILALFASITLMAANAVQAQHLPKEIKVANVKRPNNLKISTGELNRFYQALFQEEVSFRNMKLAKAELAYYLLAQSATDSRIFAFELKQSGKRLCLDPFLPVHSCNKGKLELRTFLQVNGKVNGCKLGVHIVKVWQNNEE